MRLSIQMKIVIIKRTLYYVERVLHMSFIRLATDFPIFLFLNLCAQFDGKCDEFLKVFFLNFFFDTLGRLKFQIGNFTRKLSEKLRRSDLLLNSFSAIDSEKSSYIFVATFYYIFAKRRPIWLVDLTFFNSLSSFLFRRVRSSE